jgi:hypothetical protein
VAVHAARTADRHEKTNPGMSTDSPEVDGGVVHGLDRKDKNPGLRAPFSSGGVVSFTPLLLRSRLSFGWSLAFVVFGIGRLS